METMQRATWTDERLDDLNRHVENGFNRVDADIREMRGEMNARFERVDERFDALNHTILRFGGGLVALFVGGFVTLLIAHA
jgi:hypothetical protein